MENIKIKELTGMQVFTIVWFGQLISIIGTSMTRFGLMVWSYERIGKASTTAILGFFSILPYVVLSPIAGVIIDRFDRKKIMILSDFIAGLVSALILGLFITGNLQVWHLFITEAVLGAVECFQTPAYTASITLLIPKDKYSRASGMRSFSSYVSQVFAPILGGILVTVLGLQGILIIDIITFMISILTMLFVNIPNPEIKQEKQDNMWSEFKFGIDYLIKRKGLFWLMMVFLVINFFAAMTYYGILPAMILARTHNNKMILAGVQSALGIGGVVGSLIVSFWKAPKKKVKTMFMSVALSYLLGDIFLGIGNAALIWYTAAFLSSLFLPFTMSSQNTLWQSKVEPNLQGRVFSMNGMLQLASMPLGYIAGGLLADYVFEPAMRSGGNLNSVLGWVFGSGAGSGMAVMFTINGVLGVLICIGGYFLRDVRYLEDNLPDYDMGTEA